ncbi:hypothetical protein QZH41_003488 [Actinostola sp. cb2023]|nr:hypothetical protein QZH41_003488 [Actinostola sp. cb2023]
MEKICIATWVVLFGLVLVSKTAAQTPVSFLPVLFVSPLPDHPSPDSAVLYGATVCDGKLYNGELLVARVNLPHGWNPILGYIAKLEVCESTDCAKIYCSNYVGGKFDGNHYCNFTYNASMGDIYMRVTAGKSPNIDWTVAVEFVDKKTWIPPPSLLRDIHEYPEPVAKNGVRADMVVLMQIVKTATEQTVKTLSYKEYFFRFCPDRGTGNRYDITIAVTGTDSKSAMATYTCLPTELPCTVTSSTHYDPRESYQAITNNI